MADQANQNRASVHAPGKRSSLHLTFQEKKAPEITHNAIDYSKSVSTNKIDQLASFEPSKNVTRVSSNHPRSSKHSPLNMSECSPPPPLPPKLKHKSKSTHHSKNIEPLGNVVNMNMKLPVDCIINRKEPHKSCIKSNEEVLKQKENARSTVKWRIGKNSIPEQTECTPTKSSICSMSADVDLVFQDPCARDQKKQLLFLPLPPSGAKHHSHHHHHHHHHRDGSNHDSRFHRSCVEENPLQLHSSQYDTTEEEVESYRERISRGFCHNIQLSGKLNISPDMQVEFIAEDLKDLGEIGRGGFGTVNKMVHRKSNTIMAVKRIRITMDENEQKQLRDLEVAMWSNECPFIVQFYGATLKEGDCWICMELMDTSLDKFYKFVYEKLNEGIPESILGKITVATLTALNYLKEKLKLIHRDVKPSNILLDRRGNIKLCDFGISGHLVDSIAKTRDAGCRPYMAPERIDPTQAKGYDVRSDVWSLGITLMELATGSFPYPKWNSVFEQLTQVVQGEPPRLNPTENGNTFTDDFVNFVNTCLTKDESDRPKYKQLLDHTFVVRSIKDMVNVSQYVQGILDKMENNGKSIYTFNSYNY